MVIIINTTHISCIDKRGPINRPQIAQKDQIHKIFKKKVEYGSMYFFRALSYSQ